MIPRFSIYSILLILFRLLFRLKVLKSGRKIPQELSRTLQRWITELLRTKVLCCKVRRIESVETVIRLFEQLTERLKVLTKDNVRKDNAKEFY